MFEIELYLSFKNGRLNNGIFTIKDGHVGVKKVDSFFVDDIFNVKKGFKAIFTK